MSRKNSIVELSEPKNAEFHDIFYTYEHLKLISCSVDLSMEKVL